MKRSFFASLLGAVLLGSAFPAGADTKSLPPNIIFILSDDQ